jgi:hypothetical protein
MKPTTLLSVPVLLVSRLLGTSELTAFSWGSRPPRSAPCEADRL